MEAGITMKGEAGEGQLIELLLQLSSGHQFSGSVDVFTKANRGQIWMRKGLMVAADWMDLEGEEAVKAMVRLANGRYEVEAGTAFPARTISQDTGSLLKACVNGEDRRAEPVSQVPVRSKRMSLAPVLTWAKRVAIAAGILILVGVGVSTGMERWAALQEDRKAPAPVPVTVSVPSPVVNQVQQDGWPCLNLSALVACGKSRGCAILNGQLVEIGGQVDGITLRSIHTSGVLLEYQGQRRFIAMEKRMAL